MNNITMNPLFFRDFKQRADDTRHQPEVTHTQTHTNTYNVKYDLLICMVHNNVT